MTAKEKIRTEIKKQNNESLMKLWKLTREDPATTAIAVNAILETELEARGLIKLNEDTFEYEICK